MNSSKLITAMAVLALACAGGLVAFDESDAADADKYLTITYDGFVETSTLDAIFTIDSDAGESIVYVTVFDENAEISIVNMDVYNAYIKPFMKAGVVSIPYEVVKYVSASKTVKATLVDSENAAYDANIAAAVTEYDLDDTMTVEDLNTALATFTATTIDKFGAITGGISTVVKLYGFEVAKAVEIGVIDPALIYTQEDLEAALAVVPEGYVTQEALDAAVAEAVAAVEPPANNEQLWMAIAIVGIVATAALGLYTVASYIRKRKA